MAKAVRYFAYGSNLLARRVRIETSSGVERTRRHRRLLGVATTDLAGSCPATQSR